jgi:hypothetical protein
MTIPETVAQEVRSGHQPGGGSLPLDPLHLSALPDVSRLCPVLDRLSKARNMKDPAAQSKSIERLFGRGKAEREPADPRRSREFDQAERFAASDVGAANASTGSKRAANGPARAVTDGSPHRREEHDGRPLGPYAYPGAPPTGVGSTTYATLLPRQ